MGCGTRICPEALCDQRVRGVILPLMLILVVVLQISAGALAAALQRMKDSDDEDEDEDDLGDGYDADSVYGLGDVSVRGPKQFMFSDIRVLIQFTHGSDRMRILIIDFLSSTLIICTV